MNASLIKTVKPFIVKYEPEILMSMGLTGLIFSTVWTAKATVDAVKLVEKRKEELNTNKLDFKETFKTVWKCYVPSALSIALSVPCIIFGNRVSHKRNVALAAAYTLAETSLEEYRTKTKELVGEQKEKEIHEAISQDKVSKKEVSSIVLTGEGDSIFLEPITGRYFKSNWNKILKAANELNADALGGEDIITLTSWLYALGLEKTQVSDELGWSVVNGRNNLLDISIDSGITPDNVPCGVIYYKATPRYI